MARQHWPMPGSWVSWKSLTCCKALMLQSNHKDNLADDSSEHSRPRCQVGLGTADFNKAFGRANCLPLPSPSKSFWPVWVFEP